MPIITLEVMPQSTTAETISYDSFSADTRQTNTVDETMKDPNEMPFLMDKNEETAGTHFLVDKSEQTENNEQNTTDQEDNSGSLNVRSELLEYTTRSDGSVCCRICGKVLASRTHWYRHKYRAHPMHPVNPEPLLAFQCELCLIYFKSRKGYIGHIASKHSETMQDASPVLTNAQAEALAKENSIIQQHPVQPEPFQEDPMPMDPDQRDLMEVDVKREPDPELAIPKSVVPTYQTVAVKQTSRNTEAPQKRTTRSTRQSVPRNLGVLENKNVEKKNEWKERRSREEKLVADIIARVRRECEEQGSGGSTRRGYSRKSVHT